MPAEETPIRPFSSLIAGSSLVIGALYLVGFAYRWSFYYNFGVPEIVFGLSFPTFLVASLELFRHPLELLKAMIVIVLILVLLEGLFSLVRLALRRRKTSQAWQFVAILGGFLGLENSLVRDILRALGIAYALYLLISAMGFQNYLDVVSGRAGEVFPAVTLMNGGADGSALPLSCGQSKAEPYRFIGDAVKMRALGEKNRACSLDGRRWRLLFRDEKFVYLFESRPDPDGLRPLTLVVPTTANSLLVLNQ